LLADRSLQLQGRKQSQRREQSAAVDHVHRAIATRYDKLARNFLAAVQLVAAIILLN
jgi:ATP phosphoribosyltransferase